jgi:hypothetical protein
VIALLSCLTACSVDSNSMEKRYLIHWSATRDSDKVFGIAEDSAGSEWGAM